MLPGHRGPRAIVPHQKATVDAQGAHAGPYAAASHGQRGRLGSGQVGHGGELQYATDRRALNSRRAKAFATKV